MALLEVKDLRTEFFSSKTSSVCAVANVSFNINKGEILGLVGESGCGKSTLALSLMLLAGSYGHLLSFKWLVFPFLIYI